MPNKGKATVGFPGTGAMAGPSMNPSITSLSLNVTQLTSDLPGEQSTLEHQEGEIYLSSGNAISESEMLRQQRYKQDGDALLIATNASTTAISTDHQPSTTRSTPSRELLESVDWRSSPAATKVKAASYPPSNLEVFQMAKRMVMRDPAREVYRPEASLHRIAVKIPGHEPSDMPSDWQRPFTSLAASVGMQVRSSYVRKGCVHLLLELGHLNGLSDDNALTFISNLPPEQWLVLLGQDAMMTNQDIVLQVSVGRHLKTGSSSNDAQPGQIDVEEEAFAAVEAARLPFSAMSTAVLEDVFEDSIAAQSAPLHLPPRRRGTVGSLIHSRNNPGGSLGGGFLLSSGGGAAGSAERASPASTRGSSLMDSRHLRRHPAVSRSLSQPAEEMMQASSQSGRRPDANVHSPIARPVESAAEFEGNMSSEVVGTTVARPPPSYITAGEVSESTSLPSHFEPATTSTWILSFGPDPAQPPALRRHPESRQTPDLVCITPLCILIPPTPPLSVSQTATARQVHLESYERASTRASTSAVQQCTQTSTLYAAGRFLQLSAVVAGPLKCWVRQRGLYLPNSIAIIGGGGQTSSLQCKIEDMMPPSLPGDCDLLKIDICPPFSSPYPPASSHSASTSGSETGGSAAFGSAFGSVSPSMEEACRPRLLPGLLQIECQRGNNLLGSSKPVLVVTDPGIHAEISSLWARIREPGCMDLSMADALVQDLGMWIEAVEKIGTNVASEPFPMAARGAHHGTMSTVSSMDASSVAAFKSAEIEAEAELISQAELESLKAWAMRSGTRMLLHAISQVWPCLVGCLTAGLVDVLGASLHRLSLQAMATEGLGLLHLAVRSRNADIVEVFLSLGSRYNHEWDPTSAGIAGLTPLHLAAVLPDRGDIACRLLQQLPGAPQAWFIASCTDGSTPQSMALAAGNRLPSRLAEVLLEHHLGHPAAVQMVQHMMAARRGVSRSFTGPLDGRGGRTSSPSHGTSNNSNGVSSRSGRLPISPTLDAAQLSHQALLVQQQQVAEQQLQQLLQQQQQQQERFLFEMLDTVDDSRCSDQEDYGLLLSAASIGGASAPLASLLASRGSMVIPSTAPVLTDTPGSGEHQSIGGPEVAALPSPISAPVLQTLNIQQDVWAESLARSSNLSVAEILSHCQSSLISSATCAAASEMSGAIRPGLRPPWVPPTPALSLRDNGYHFDASQPTSSLESCGAVGHTAQVSPDAIQSALSLAERLPPNVSTEPGYSATVGDKEAYGIKQTKSSLQGTSLYVSCQQSELMGQLSGLARRAHKSSRKILRALLFKRQARHRPGGPKMLQDIDLGRLSLMVLIVAIASYLFNIIIHEVWPK